MSEITIGHIEISVDFNEVKKTLRDDDTLNEVMDKFIEELDDDIEVFDRQNNIAVTEEGYYIAIRSKELEKVDE